MKFVWQSYDPEEKALKRRREEHPTFSYKGSVRPVMRREIDETVLEAFADHDFERMLHEMEAEDFSEWDVGVSVNDVLETIDAQDTESSEFIPAKHFDLIHPTISGRNRGNG